MTIPSLTRRSFLAGAVASAQPRGNLKIASVRAAPFIVRQMFGSVPRGMPDFDPRRWRSFGPFSQLQGAILVQIRTEEGITGYGMGGGGGAACYIIEHHLGDLLIGANPLNIELLWEQLFASSSFYGRRGVAIQAISGIDLALWDIAGKHAGLPVYRLLGGPVRDRIPAYYTGNDVERGIEMGFRGVKIGGFADMRAGRDGMRDNVGRIHDARKRIGDEPLLMIDALCAWDVPYTLELADRIADARLYFLEEPLLPDDIAGYAHLCREVRTTRIASGEHEATLYGFQELLRNRAVQVAQPDVTWSGGLTEARRVAAACDAAGVPLIPHRGGSVYGMTLILTSRSPVLAESFGFGSSGNEAMELLSPKFEKGHYLPPEGPGFGIAFSDAFLRKHVPHLAASLSRGSSLAAYRRGFPDWSLR